MFGNKEVNSIEVNIEFVQKENNLCFHNRTNSDIDNSSMHTTYESNESQNEIEASVCCKSEKSYRMAIDEISSSKESKVQKAELRQVKSTFKCIYCQAKYKREYLYKQHVKICRRNYQKVCKIVILKV